MTITRVVTINTGKGDGPYRERIALLSRQLAVLEPDIVALQECFVAETAGLDTARLLAESLEMCLFASPARQKPRACEGELLESTSGLALLARGSWLTMQTVALPSDPADGQRIGQVGTVCLGGRVVRIGNVHLSHLRGADDLRARQLRTALTACSDGGQVDATFLCGDFNTTLDGSVLRPFTSACGEGPRLVDTWSAAHGDPNRGTLTRTGSEGRCVDFIFSMVSPGGRQPCFANPRLVLDEPGPRGVLPSDHFGVMTDLRLPDAGAEE